MVPRAERRRRRPRARSGAYRAARSSMEARKGTSWACTEPRSPAIGPAAVRWGDRPGALHQATAGRSPQCARRATRGRGRARALRRSSSPVGLATGWPSTNSSPSGSPPALTRCTLRVFVVSDWYPSACRDGLPGFLRLAGLRWLAGAGVPKLSCVAPVCSLCVFPHRFEGCRYRLSAPGWNMLCRG